MTLFRKREFGFAASWAVAAVLGAGIVIVAVAALTGYVYVGTKSPTQQVGLSTNVCKLTDIEKYNSLLNPATKQDDRASFITSLTERQDYDKDATCVFMLAQSYIVTHDVENARTMVGKLSDLAAQGDFADSRINDLSGVEQLNVTIQSMNTSDTSPAGEG